MSTDNQTIRSILGKPARAAPVPETSQTEREGDYTAYAQGRISRHSQLTLVLRQADGSARAFAYSYLYGIESENPALGFTIDFTQHRVKVQGSNLQILFRLVCQHRVAEIRVAQRSQILELDPQEPVVEQVEVSAAR